jgi:glycosyltransferase involved in cell wall biosynthesis
MVVKKNIWVINAQENPIEGSGEGNQRLWRSNTLAQEFARQGHNAFRWRSTFSHNKKQQLVDGPHLETVDGVKQIYIPTTGYKGHFSLRRILSHYFLGRGFNRVIQHFDLEKPDIIHICNVPLDLLLQVSKYARRQNIPMVLDVRDLWPEAYANIIPSRFHLARLVVQRILVFMSVRYRSIVRHAFAVTTISDAMMDYVLSSYGRRRAEHDRVFHIGASHTVSSPEQVPGKGPEIVAETVSHVVQDAPLRLVYAGNIGFQTDFDRIVSLNQTLEARNLNVEITICGNGPRLEELRAKTADMERINFIGWLNGDRLREQLDNADFGLLFFFPNLDFQLSIPSKVSEYLSSTKAILSISDGSVRTLIAEHKVGVDCHGMSDDEIADQLAVYASNRSRLDTFAKNARHLYQEKFSQQKITRQMAEHMLMILEGKNQS